MERTGTGDPARTVALLWRDPAALPRRATPRGLDVDAVVAAATALADRDGLAALSMRRVAEELGSSAMTLYTYVPGKAELLDLMLDAAYARMERADLAGRPWRARLRLVADENRALYAAHPWAADVATLRPPLGPGLLRKYEHELSALDGLGLSDLERDDALALLLTVVRACARDALAAQDDGPWWEAAGPALERLVPRGAYPLAERVGTAAGQERGTAPGSRHSRARVRAGSPALLRNRWSARMREHLLLVVRRTE